MRVKFSAAEMMEWYNLISVSDLIIVQEV